MDNAKQHWKILNDLTNDLAFRSRVRSFLVIGKKGEGVIMVTENGDGFWLGKMQFGCGETKTVIRPTQLYVSDLIQMAQGNRHILLLNKRGQIYSMGMNNCGQLGLGTVDQETRFSPQLIFSPLKFTSVRCGYAHSVALTYDGKVWAWGENNYGQVGVPKSTSSIQTFHQIPELDSHRIVAVECGYYHSLALTDQGEVYAWGWNDYGQLGNGSESSTHIPTRIPTPSPVQSMAAGYLHTLLLTQTGEVYACGSNACGQLSHPISTKPTIDLSKIAGLPLISQIASHHATNLSVAMSPDHQCFAWGKFTDKTFISTPFKLSPVYSTVESPLSFYSSHRNTPRSVQVSAKQFCSNSVPDRTLPANNRLVDRIGKMFDNPDSSPDVRFQVGDQTFLAHRSVLQISSGHFHRLFSSHSANFNPPSSISSTPQYGPSRSQPTTNPSKPDANSTTSHCPQVTIPITDHSYPAFYAYLHFLYLGIFKVSPEHLLVLYSLSVAYLESDLQQLCLSRMRSTLSPSTCCHYYQFTLRQNSLSELATFQQEVVQYISANFLKVITTDVYQSMNGDLCKKLTLSMANHIP